MSLSLDVGSGTSSDGNVVGTGIADSELVFLLGANALSSMILGFNGQIPVFSNATCKV
jgi:hypothetical protein